MRLFYWGNDGGKFSTVKGFWLVEWKKLFSVVLLRFDPGSRDAHHSHAFNSISWLFKGRLIERHLDGAVTVHYPSLWPIMTYRDTFHKVESVGRTWVLSFRGPWEDTWEEVTPTEGRYRLAKGRVRV